MSFSLFFQSLINGLNQGAIYALIALGYTMVYGIIRMINFAHGDFIMIGAYTLFYTIPLMVNAGMPAWLAVILAIAVCAVVGVLVEILAYRTVQAIREDYIAAAASGINVTYYKVLTFAISAFFAGIGGGVYAHYMTAMIPTNFNFNYSAELLSEVIIGGTGSLTGSIIGAAILSSLPELMRDFSTYRMLAYSVVLVLVMLFRPGGIFGRWEFSLTRLLGRLAHPKAKAKKGA